MPMSNTDKPLSERLQSWKCSQCGERAVRLERFPYSCTILHDGTTYSVTVPELETPRCRNCGAIVLTTPGNEQIDNELRRLAGLMMPQEISRRRQGAGPFARRVGPPPRRFTSYRRALGGGRAVSESRVEPLAGAVFRLPNVRDHLAASAAMEGQTTTH